jgi:hypothetical protein
MYYEAQIDGETIIQHMARAARARWASRWERKRLGLTSQSCR